MDYEATLLRLIKAMIRREEQHAQELQAMKSLLESNNSDSQIKNGDETLLKKNVRSITIEPEHQEGGCRHGQP